MQLTGRFRVLGIKKQTSAQFFRSLRIGDEFELKYNINGGYGNAPYIDIYKDDVCVHSNNAIQLSNNLSNFEL